ncbi:MAG: hypothetical protein ACR2LN_02055 [Candidatus Levyibacteriota bacterium]
MRDDVRDALIDKKLIVQVNVANEPLNLTYTIDGAHIPEIDRASAYSISCAVKVGRNHSNNAQSSCLAILPHVPSISMLSGGLMMMQEIMMAVEAAEKEPESIVMIDGSKISAIISINQFYTGIARDLPEQLKQWRDLGKKDNTREPGNTLNKFESRDWISEYVSSPNIVGNLKLVTTNNMIHEYTPELEGRFDDKTLASLILQSGEALGPMAMPIPAAPYHIAEGFPHSKNFDKVQSSLYEKGDNLIFHIYYRPDVGHGVYKIEVNEGFLRKKITDQLFAWWVEEIAAPDLQEPYSYFIADRFAKEAVSVASKALKEITRREINSLSWFFTQPYRTEK